MDNNKFSESKKYIEEMCKVVDIENPERLEVFTKDQLEVIFEALMTGTDTIDYFLNHPGFDANQMNEITLGIKFGLNVEEYAKPCYSWKQMKIIKTMLFRDYTHEELESNGFLDESSDWMELNYLTYLLLDAG